MIDLFAHNFGGWTKGVHEIPIDHTIMGPTCGLLPIGIKSTILTMSGLRWNLSEFHAAYSWFVLQL